MIAPRKAPPVANEADAPLSVLTRPAWIKDRYRRLVVVAHETQIETDIAADTLIVTTDWLSWRRLVERKAHALHFESALEHWPGDGECPPDHLVRGTEWMYANARDATSFRGVSLGKLFNWEVAASRHAAFRVFHALERLVAEFRPQEIVLTDLRGEYDLIPDAAKEILVRAVASRYGAVFIKTPAPADISSQPFPHVRFAREAPPPSFARRMARAIYEGAVHAACLMRNFFFDGARVLIVQNPLTIYGLLETFPSHIRPVVLARHHRKSPRFVFDCLKRGVFLARLPWAWLTPADRRALRDMRRILGENWRTPATDAVDEATRVFVRTHVLADGILEAKAIEAKRIAKLLAVTAPARLLIGDSGNAFNRLLLETGFAYGIPADELLNGFFLSRQRTDARCGDRYRPPLIDRLLSWGDHDERWLRQIGSTVALDRVGCPLVDILQRSPLPPRTGGKNVLLLPLHPDRLDARGLEAQVFSTLIESARALRAKGFQVRVKIHPGFHDLRYYVEMRRDHGLDAEMHKDGTLLEHLQWADVVVGPLASNALIETLAMGRSYVPMVLSPSSVEPDLVRPVPVAASIEEMLSLVQKGGLNCDRTLHLLADYDGLRSSSSRVWAAVSEAVRGHAAAETTITAMRHP